MSSWRTIHLPDGESTMRAILVEISAKWVRAPSSDSPECPIRVWSLIGRITGIRVWSRVVTMTYLTGIDWKEANPRILKKSWQGISLRKYFFQPTAKTLRKNSQLSQGRATCEPKTVTFLTLPLKISTKTARTQILPLWGSKMSSTSTLRQ